jgi:hypothetical protein
MLQKFDAVYLLLSGRCTEPAEAGPEEKDNSSLTALKY